MKKVLLLGILTLSILTLKAQIFIQNFNGTTDYTTLVSATPNSNQFNSIGTAGANTTVAIVSSKLKYTRSTASSTSGSFTRNKDFSPIPEIIIYKVDIELTGNTSSQTSSAVFQVGSGFSSSSNSSEPNANLHSRFSLNMETTAGQFSVRDIKSGTNGTGTYSGTQTLTWVINNSSSSYSYTPPSGIGTETVAADTWDLFVGNTKELNDRVAQNVGIDLKNLKFAFTDGIGALTLDNINIEAVTPLPISLTSFTAKPIDKTILLNWETASEKNNQQFEVLKSADGNNFKAIIKLDGAGNSDSEKSYSFVDENPYAGANYYQLRQTDFNGTKTVSNVISANAKIEDIKLSAYTSNSTVTITVNSPNQTDGEIAIFDMNGRKLDGKNLILNKGYNEVNFNQTLTPGTYFINLISAGKSTSLKFIK